MSHEDNIDFGAEFLRYCGDNNTSEVESLLNRHEKTALINFKDEVRSDVFLFALSIERTIQEGRNALHVAAFEGHTEIVSLLVNNGFDIDAYWENVRHFKFKTTLFIMHVYHDYVGKTNCFSHCCYEWSC